MKRKDCDHFDRLTRPQRCARFGSLFPFGVMVVVGVMTSATLGGSIRVWSSAVVVDDTVYLGDLAQLRDFATDPALAKLVVTTAPQPGGSRVIHRDMIRSVVEASGANMATVMLGGATQCAVTRPATPVVRDAASSQHRSTPSTRNTATSRRAKRQASPAGVATLRQAVVDHFNSELSRYGGTAEIVFDRASQQVLDLSGPDYTFHVRRRNGPPLGLIQAEVDVTANGVSVQTVPLVLQISMTRHVVVARRSINQGAAVRASDVEVTPLRFSRIQKLGLDHVALAVGQRAKRFIAAGTAIESEQLESVPLVVRGQLVTLTSVSGSVRVVTTVKAQDAGLLGETITVRSTDNRRVAFDAVVAGPGQVQVGGRPASSTAAIALGGQR